MATVEDMVQAKLKVRAYKNEENPDGRVTLCGEKVQCDDDGREFFVVPAHQKDYLSKLLTGYDISEPFEVGQEAPPIKKARARR